MTEYLVAFITGLTTGGLSCLAVQGGLLASSLASQIESDMQGKSSAQKPRVAQPILWFLISKLVAYTILGFFLGWLGSVLQLNPVSRAILQILIGIFMVGQALRLFNVHPIFRYFNIKPPKFITRYIRRKSKNNSPVVTPLFMGALTVLIPCGITQVVMASAIAAGNPLTGALLMFSFILGTSPVFFVVAYFATRLGERLEKYFMKFVAVVVLVLGLLTINTGLNLMGSPLSFKNLTGALTGSKTVSAESLPVEVPTTAPIVDNLAAGSEICPLQATSSDGSSIPCGETNQTGGCVVINSQANQVLIPTEYAPAPTQPQPAATPVEAYQEIVLQVLNSGYSPEVTYAKAGVPIKLVLESKNVRSCSLAFVIPSLNIQVLLKPTGSYTIDIPAQPAGSQLPYSCSMGMYTGVIIFDN